MMYKCGKPKQPCEWARGLKTGGLFKFIVGKEKEPFFIHTIAIQHLGARPLDALMSNGMIESQEGCTTWEEVHPTVFRCFLSFVYTGSYNEYKAVNDATRREKKRREEKWSEKEWSQRMTVRVSKRRIAQLRMARSKKQRPEDSASVSTNVRALATSDPSLSGLNRASAPARIEEVEHPISLVFHWRSSAFPFCSVDDLGQMMKRYLSPNTATSFFRNKDGASLFSHFLGTARVAVLARFIGDSPYSYTYRHDHGSLHWLAYGIDTAPVTMPVVATNTGLWILADKYCIDALKPLVETRLRMALSSLALTGDNVKRLLVLIADAYHHTQDNSALRRIFADFMACALDREALEQWIRTKVDLQPEFLVDLLRSLCEGRLNENLFARLR